ncbi:hypothetical protein E0H22_09230 [Rhodopseudomonas boonkerdii]|uniref:hypothetical protein n=1 Tax=Rhodopseudomonas boonkerdii TaxID=475937 RepID=UPI001E59C42F|nr:hypothetical protein [Rhodopseudomonas boonkerdii]UGV25852.1 hypothetical protein E0H22_09230 [Rhodopseudomonas boonkerdii]
MQFALRSFARFHGGGSSLHLRSKLLLLAFCASTALLLAGILLELGVLRSVEVFQAPYQEASAGSSIRVVPVRGGGRQGYLWVRSDAEGGSDLRAWLGDVELQPHQNITESMNGFSHWGRAVYFRPPLQGGAEPAPGQLTIRYHVRFKNWALYGSLLLFAVLAWSARFVPELKGVVQRLHRLSLRCLVFILCSLVALAIFAFASCIGGAVTGYSLYPMYGYDQLRQWWPAFGELIHFEPILPLALLSLAMILCVLSQSTSPGDERTTRLEAVVARLWTYLGLPALLGLFSLSIAIGAWSGNFTQLDVPYMNIAGLVPNSDARGYFSEALGLLQDGGYGDFGARRPLATILRAWTVWLAGNSYVTVVLLQTVVVATAIYVATTSILRWRGIAAALCFLAFSYIIVRPFIVTTYTEALGVTLAYLSVPFFIRGLVHFSRAYLLIAFAIFLGAMSVRSGSVLTIPAFIVWGLFFGPGGWKQRGVFALLASAAAVAVSVSGNFLNLFYKLGEQGAVDTALPWLICGLSLGTNYHICETRYAAEIATIASEAQVAKFLYAVAWKNFLANPWDFFHVVITTGTQFVTDAPTLLFRGYSSWRTQTYFPVWSFYALVLVGWGAICVRSFDRRIFALIAFLAASMIVSAAFVYITDGWRIFIVCYPLVAAILAGGLGATQISNEVPVRLRTRQFAFAALVAALVIAFVPAIFIANYRSMGSVSTPTAAPDEIIIGPARPLVGFMVVDHSSRFPPKVPSITMSEFRDFLKTASLLETTPLESLPPVPFGFIYPTNVPAGMRTFNAVLVPSAVLLEERHGWRLKTVPFNPVERWVKATEAISIP